MQRDRERNRYEIWKKGSIKTPFRILEFPLVLKETSWPLFSDKLSWWILIRIVIMRITRNHGLVIFQPFWLERCGNFCFGFCHDFQLTYINSLKAFQHFDALEELQQQIEAAETQAALARSAMQMVTATTQQGLSKDEGFFCWLQRAKLVGTLWGLVC